MILFENINIVILKIFFVAKILRLQVHIAQANAWAVRWLLTPRPLIVDHQLVKKVKGRWRRPGRLRRMPEIILEEIENEIGSDLCSNFRSDFNYCERH